MIKNQELFEHALCIVYTYDKPEIYLDIIMKIKNDEDKLKEFILDYYGYN